MNEDEARGFFHLHIYRRADLYFVLKNSLLKGTC